MTPLGTDGYGGVDQESGRGAAVTGQRATKDSRVIAPLVPARNPSLSEAPTTTREWRRSGVATAVGLGVLAWLVSLIGSWNASLWTDEVATVSGADRSLPQLWALVQNLDVVHGGYYAFMHLWIAVFGSSPVSLRMPSAIAIGVAASGVYILGRRLASPGVGVASALVFTILPRVTWMGIEARSYAFTATAAVWLTVLLIGMVMPRTTDARGGSVSLWRWIAYAAIAALAIVINIYFVFLLAAHAATLLFLRQVDWRTRWTWLATAFTGFLIASPVILLASRQTGQLGDEALTWVRLIRNILVNQYSLGDTPTVDTDGRLALTSMFSGASAWQGFSILLATLCWVLVGWSVIRYRRNRPSPPIRPGDFLAWLIPWMVLPTLVVGAYSLLAGPLYNPRYFSFTTPALAVLIGLGICALSRRWLQVAVMTLLIALALPVYLSQRTVNAKSSSDWSQVAAVIEGNKAPGQAVYFAPRYPVDGETTGQSTRGIQIGYPGAFTGLIDLTYDVSPSDDASLTGQSYLLAASADRLDQVETVWAIRRNGDPSGTEQIDDQLFTAAGFTPRMVWRGQLDSVTQFSRG